MFFPWGSAYFTLKRFKVSFLLVLLLWQTYSCTDKPRRTCQTICFKSLTRQNVAKQCRTVVVHVCVEIIVIDYYCNLSFISLISIGNYLFPMEIVILKIKILTFSIQVGHKTTTYVQNPVRQGTKVLALVCYTNIWTRKCSY